MKTSQLHSTSYLTGGCVPIATSTGYRYLRLRRWQVPSTFLALLTFLAPGYAAAQTAPSLPERDRIRIAEGLRLAEQLGNRVWPHWDKAPFSILLVTAENEFLIAHPQPSEDFQPLGRDPLLQREVWFRKRTYQPNLLATFPAVGGVETIVIGQAENTSAQTSTRWVITLLHEHFHQLQGSQPDHYADVNALGLARGDQSGMWMLNYPFPYTRETVVSHFAHMSQSLAEALDAREQSAFPDKCASYISQRSRFSSLLDPDDYKYFAFQVWKEGVARYTELRLAQAAAEHYEPSREFTELGDYRRFKDVAAEIVAQMETELDTPRLDQSHRSALYNFGAAECLLLDAYNPAWQDRYFSTGFSLDKHFEAAGQPSPSRAGQ